MKLFVYYPEEDGYKLIETIALALNPFDQQGTRRCSSSQKIII